MEKSSDIAIIGGGLAAYAAAVELCDSGKRVLLIRSAVGRTALSSGAWDVGDVESLQCNEFHPYSVIAQNFSKADFPHFFKKHLERAVNQLPLKLAGSVEQNLSVITSFGTVKSTAFVQSSMMDADVLRMKKAKLLVLGIRGFPAFNARFIAESLLALQEAKSQHYFESCDSLEVEMPDALSHSSLNAVELALHFDREETSQKFIQTVLQCLDGKTCNHLLLPPVLGAKNTAAILESLRKTTKIKVAETLAAPMSVPGWRLNEAIQEFFQNKGVEILEGEAIGFEKSGRLIQSLDVKQEDTVIKVKAKAFLLATGKYIGGGIRKDPQFRETVFGLPVFAQGKVLQASSLMSLARPTAAEVQPFLRAGVSINPSCQPLDEDQQVVYDNLFAAGSVLSGFDPAHEGCAEGVAILSGTVAAQSLT